MNARISILAGVIAVAVAIPAHATIKAHLTRPGNYTFAQGTNNPVPLAAGNVLSLGFSGSGKWIITYSAECAVSAAAGNSSTWMSLEIRVDGVAVAPTDVAGNQDAFCTSNGTAGADGWSNNTIIVVTPALALGPHVVEVRASIINGIAGTSGWLGDSTILISK
jgi:hypothetical protein